MPLVMSTLFDTEIGENDLIKYRFNENLKIIKYNVILTFKIKMILKVFTNYTLLGHRAKLW